MVRRLSHAVPVTDCRADTICACLDGSRHTPVALGALLLAAIATGFLRRLGGFLGRCLSHDDLEVERTRVVGLWRKLMRSRGEASSNRHRD